MAFVFEFMQNFFVATGGDHCCAMCGEDSAAGKADAAGGAGDDAGEAF